MTEYSHTNLGTVIKTNGEKTSLVDVLNELHDRIKQLEMTNPAGSQQNAPTSK